MSLETDLLKSPGFRAALKEAGTVVAGYARYYDAQAHGPWMPSKGSETIVVQQDADGVRVANLDHAGHLLEWGSRNNPPYAPLRRAVHAAGLRFTESR